MPTDLDSPVTEAAGGVVERDTPGGRRIAVIRRERYGEEWALPKGKRRKGESWQAAALREVREETGLRTTITGLAGATGYLAAGVPKIVVYWRMKVSRVGAFVPNEEVVELAWLTPKQAIARLSHPEEARLVETACKRKPLGK